jgi:NADPH-dependent ferric siderophore reductase
VEAISAGRLSGGGWMEELPRDTRALVVAEIDGPAEEQKLSSAAPFDVIWVHRNTAPAGDPTLLLQRLQSVDFPAGDYFAWVAAETQVARAVRQFLLTERSADKQWVKAAGYWRRGATGSHERIED